MPQIHPMNMDMTNLILEDLKKHQPKLSGRPEIRIIFFGSPDFSALVLKKIVEFTEQTNSSFTVTAVITQPDKPVGRKQILTPSPVALTVEKYNIPVLKPTKLNEEFIKAHLPLLEADLFIVAAYGKIIPQAMLDIPTSGALNIHPSLLPKYRGASPIQAAILNGDKFSGVTIIKMDQKMDHGPIVAQEKIPLSPTDTFSSLAPKMFLAGSELLKQILPDYLSGKLQPIPQDDAIATYCYMIKKEDGLFDINNPPGPEQLDSMIRAYFPWPTVWSKWNNKIVKFLPGGLIQLEGKKPVPLKDFLRGYSTFPLKS